MTDRRLRAGCLRTPALRVVVAVAVLAGVPAAVPAAAGSATAAQASRSRAVAAGEPGGAVPPQLIVPGRGARAVIETRPFRLATFDGTGKPVLRQVTNTRSAPLLGLSAVLPGGTEPAQDRTLYAPFTFEVGGSLTAQYPASPWVGALIGAANAGVQYAAQDVVSYRRIPSGLRLVVSTNDPTGRELVVEVAGDRPGVMSVSMRVTPDSGVVAVADSFASTPTEAFHGFGGRHTRVNQRGRTLTGWIQAQNVSAGQLQPLADLQPGSGGEEYLFPNGPGAAYYVSNSFISSRGYGFVLEGTGLSRWRLADGRDDAWQVVVAGSGLRYQVASGGVRQAVGTVSALNGRHRVPPPWAQGTTLYRGVKVLSADADTPESYAAKVRADLARIDREKLGVTSYGLEGWAILDRPVLRQLVQEFHRRGIKVLFYLRCFVSADPANTEPPELFVDAVRNGWVATTATGAPYLFGSTFVAGAAALIDFTDPGAVRWWEGRVREVLDLGADGFMQDFGEQVLADMHFDDGSTGATMHNAYPTQYHRATRRIVDAYERTHVGRKVFFFTRAGFSGSPGAAAFEGANFPGDETTDWTLSSGLPSIVPDMLNRAVGGAWGFTTDIGGYFDYTSPAVTEELFTRWHQASALMPYFRVHNSSSTGVKMPWDFGVPALQRFRHSAQLHARALPYLRRLERIAVETGVPPTRPLWLSFPSEPSLQDVADQWMLGDDVLVAPVLRQGARARDVLLPRGCWRYEPSGRLYDGGRRVRVAADLSTLPYFTRCGSRPFGQ